MKSLQATCSVVLKKNSNIPRKLTGSLSLYTYVRFSTTNPTAHNSKIQGMTSLPAICCVLLKQKFHIQSSLQAVFGFSLHISKVSFPNLLHEVAAGNLLCATKARIDIHSKLFGSLCFFSVHICKVSSSSPAALNYKFPNMKSLQASYSRELKHELDYLSKRTGSLWQSCIHIKRFIFKSFCLQLSDYSHEVIAGNLQCGTRASS